MALVSYEQQPARIIIALANRKDPKPMEPVNIRIGPLEFDHADYDVDGPAIAKKPRKDTSFASRQAPSGSSA
jgi:hypothetical protein